MEIALRRDWRLTIRSLPWGWTGASLLLVLVLAAPIVAVPLLALRPAGAAWNSVSATLLPGYLANTVVVAGVAGATAFVVGVGSAWLVAVCEFPGRRIFRWALALPLAVPAYIAAYTYVGMVDVTGPIQRAVRAWVPGAADTLFYWNVMRIEVVAVILGLVLYPYVYLPTRVLLERRVGRALEAARLHGHGHARVFWRTGLPLTRPAIAGGLALVLMEVLNDYGAVHYYGVTTLTTGIFRAWFSLGDVDTAVRLAAVLMLAVFLVLLLERWQRGRAHYDGDSRGGPAAGYRLGGVGGAAAVAFCAAPLLLGFAIPVLQLAYWAVRTAPGVVDVRFLRMAANSVGLAAGAGVLAVGIALVFAYAGRLDRTAATRSAARVALLGYSVPGAVIAVGVLVVLLGIDRALTGGSGLVLSGTLAALVFAYVVRFMAVAYLPLEAGLERTGTHVLDAARTMGATPLRTLLRVELPLLRGTVLVAATLVMIDVLKELPLTLILRPFNFDTLATRAFQLATDEQVAESAPAALVVILCAAAVVTLLHRTTGRRAHA